jgi:hypothetical protein
MTTTMWTMAACALAAVVGACAGEPGDLASTGLYKDGSTQLAAGVREYRPAYALWSDGAAKRRFLLLPDGEQIDTSDVDHWVFPVGTKLFKEFAVGGTTVETRMMHKVADDAWTFTAYVGDGPSSSVPAFGGGVQDARGTAHDVPEQAACTKCHGGAVDAVLGLSALQLADDDLLDARALNEAGLVTAELPIGLRPPGDDLQREVLGALHANCASCHNARAEGDVQLDLELRAAELFALEDTAFFRTAVDVDGATKPEWTGARKLIAPGAPDDSMLLLRMERREDGQMPPLASEVVDGTTTSRLRRFIEAL